MANSGFTTPVDALSGFTAQEQSDLTQVIADQATDAANITTLQGDVATAQGDITTLQGLVPFNTAIANATPATTDATLTTVATVAIPTDGIINITLNATAAIADGTVWASWESVQAVYVRASGTTTLEFPVAAEAAPTHSGGAGSTWRVKFDITGTSLRIQVKGAAATNIQWAVVAAGTYNQF